MKSVVRDRERDRIDALMVIGTKFRLVRSPFYALAAQMQRRRNRRSLSWRVKDGRIEWDHAYGIGSDGQTLWKHGVRLLSLRERILWLLLRRAPWPGGKP